jgi:hypothetical protein
MTTRILRMRCADPERAETFAVWLKEAGIDVTGIEDRDVLIPTSSGLFVWDIAEAACEQGCANDDEASTSVRMFLADVAVPRLLAH